MNRKIRNLRPAWATWGSGSKIIKMDEKMTGLRAQKQLRKREQELEGAASPVHTLHMAATLTPALRCCTLSLNMPCQIYMSVHHLTETWLISSSELLYVMLLWIFIHTFLYKSFFPPWTLLLGVGFWLIWHWHLTFCRTAQLFFPSSPYFFDFRDRVSL